MPSQMQLIKQTLKINFYFRLDKYRKFVQFSIFCGTQNRFLQIMKVKDFWHFIPFKRKKRKVG